MDERPHDLIDNSKSLALSQNQLNASSLMLVNEKAVACRLPVEILCNVFALVQAFDNSSGRIQNCGWIRISHVCSRWRSAAIDCAALWTSLDFRLPRMLVELFLERSKAAPLSICIHSRYECRAQPAHTHPELMARVLSQVHRIRSLVTSTGCKDAALDVLLSEWTGCTPILEVLELVQQNDESLPQDFLQDGAPRLRQLKFHGREIDWTKLPFSSSITTLSLFQGEDENFRPSKEDFFKVLSLMPALHDLTLECSLPDGDQRVVVHHNTPRFTFHSLGTLVVGDSIDHLNRFLLAIRSATFMSIWIDVYGRHHYRAVQQCLENVLAFCRTDLERNTKTPLRALNLSHKELVMDIGAGSSSSTSAGIRRVTVSFDEYYVSPHEVLEVMAGHLDFEALESLEYECEQFDDFMTSDDWRLFSQLPNLRTVSIEYSEDWEFLLLLQEKKSFWSHAGRILSSAVQDNTVVNVLHLGPVGRLYWAESTSVFEDPLLDYGKPQSHSTSYHRTSSAT